MKKLFAALVISFVSLSSMAADKRIFIINNSYSTIAEIRSSNIDNPFYSRDRLGSEYLYPGERGVLDLDDGTNYCYYDIRIIFKDGTTIDKSLNACKVLTYTIN